MKIHVEQLQQDDVFNYYRYFQSNIIHAKPLILMKLDLFFALAFKNKLAKSKFMNVHLFRR